MSGFTLLDGLAELAGQPYDSTDSVAVWYREMTAAASDRGDEARTQEQQLAIIKDMRDSLGPTLQWLRMQAMRDYLRFLLS